MNTASRMESTGEANKIHISEETANLLIKAGKQHWVTPREQSVAAKGKGVLKTYWFKRSSADDRSTRHSESAASSSHDTDPLSLEENSKATRLINWYTEILFSFLKQNFEQRNQQMATKKQGKLHSVGFARKSSQPSSRFDESKYMQSLANRSTTILEEVKETAERPSWTYQTALKPTQRDGDKDDPATSNSELPATVYDELVLYVMEMADRHRDHAFHNFDHSAHVAMSVVKLLSRVVAPSPMDLEKRASSSAVEETNTASLSSGEKPQDNNTKSGHDPTHGIISDPLTQFSCVLAALMHTVDHPGVPNRQLVTEGHIWATQYKEQSMAEQHAFGLGWTKLLEDRFQNLRSAIYTTQEEFQRFRQLLIHLVLATDVMDPELQAMRNERWNKEFPYSSNNKKLDQHKRSRSARNLLSHHHETATTTTTTSSPLSFTQQQGQSLNKGQD